jgi:tRNA A-37 threonylcarbamoyl transferase component Bud32
MRQRFEREAKMIARRSIIPHICTPLRCRLTRTASTFCVMEHLEGETLAARLTRGRCRSTKL